MKVVKFGGSSLANVKNIIKAKSIVEGDSARTFIVVSAPGKAPDFPRKITDLLIDAHAQLCYSNTCDSCNLVFDHFEELANDLGVDLENEIERVREEIYINKCDYDFVVSRGEYLMARLFAKLLGFKFLDAAKYIVIRKNGLVHFEKTRERFQKLPRGEKYVMGGFYGCQEFGDSSGAFSRVKTFTRGGSDYSGAIAAIALKADIYENFTDTYGVQSANPSIVSGTENIEEIDYDTLHKLSLGGASVIYPNCLPLLKRHDMPLKVDNTMDPGKKFTVVTRKKPASRYFSITYETKHNLHKDTVEILCVCNKIDFEINQLRKILWDVEVYLVNFEKGSFTLLSPAVNLSNVVNLLHKHFMSALYPLKENAD